MEQINIVEQKQVVVVIVQVDLVVVQVLHLQQVVKKRVQQVHIYKQIQQHVQRVQQEIIVLEEHGVRAQVIKD